MSQMTDAIRREKEYKLIIKEALEENRSKQPLPLLVTGLSDGARSVFYAAAIEDWRTKCADGAALIIVSDEGVGYRVERELTECGLRVATYPFREFVFNSHTSSHGYEYERLSVLNRILNNELDAIITTPDAALQFTIPKKVLQSASFAVRVGDELALSELALRLDALGYSRVDTVEGSGQYALRGGICDIYSPRYELPIRIDTFGDEIDRIVFFDVISQRSTEMLEEVFVTPAREMILDGDAKKRVE